MGIIVIGLALPGAPPLGSRLPLHPFAVLTQQVLLNLSIDAIDSMRGATDGSLTHLYEGRMANSLGWMDSSLVEGRTSRREVPVADSSRVAVVDDDASVREALRALLRSAGFRVETFASAEDFLHGGQSSDLACLVLDVRMSGMSGVELQDHLLASGSKLPIVFMTAHADASVRARALANGAVQFLQKPFSDDDLLEAIDASLGRTRS